MSFLLLLLGVLLVFLCFRLLKIGSREPGLPPGPPTVPLLGNLHIFPSECAHFRFTEWSRKYGGFYSLKIGPGTTVVLTDPAAGKVLIDQRSGNTVDRPAMHVADCVTGGLNTGFYTHIRRYSSSVILSVLYGKRTPRYETPETTAFFEAQHEWERVPVRWAKWKRDCARTRKLQRDLGWEEELEENGCYMEEILKSEEELGMDAEMTGYLGGVLIEGGSDTTSSFLQTLILALTAYPEAQKKAQEEIDRVVGPHRMPTLDDLDELRYIPT
ncbi:cytochrome P450 [Roridomyces roridus]|uniref:Cytochrome P450 n=1 Tax=Roridomyces roridus TaxID=1738132 RepID=A0AAD7F7J2_9AGAR|nr:cytochrome P450 [Roridomyces roridus]